MFRFALWAATVVVLISAVPAYAGIVPCPVRSLQDAVDKANGPSTIKFLGTCAEVVTISKDDITLDGGGSGTVSGTIIFDGAQRGAIINATITGPGTGILADNGASVLIRNNSIKENGDPGDHFSPGVLIDNGSSAQIRDNDIIDNTSDGVAIYNGSFGRITNNLISGNGRAAPFFEAGIQVGRAHARGQSNKVVSNPYAALSVYNDGSYRTGNFLIPGALPDNDGPFEELSIGASGTVAVDLGQMAYADLRQVFVTGDAYVGYQSMLQVRGDNVGANQTCSIIDGHLNVFGFNSGARLRFVNVTGGVSGTVQGSSVCP